MKTTLCLALVSMMILAWPGTTRADEYRIGPGDVIEVVVSGNIEMRHRTPVQLDGSISLPLIGALKVAGSTPAEARINIQAALSSRVIMQRQPTGRDLPIMIKPENVSTSVVEYRPVFVAGDVTRSGEQPFRPGMTVRHALAASGAREQTTPTGSMHYQLGSLETDFAELSAKFVSLRVVQWQLNREFGDAEDFDRASLSGVPLATVDLDTLVDLAKSQSAARMIMRQNEREYLVKAIVAADEEIKTLKSQLAKEHEGTAADAADLERVQKLLEKGALAMPRVTETRRALLLSSTRELQTQAELSGVKRQRNELQRKSEQLDAERKLEVARELQETAAALAATEGKLRTTWSAMQKISSEAGIAMGVQSGPLSIKIFRNQADGSVKEIVANPGMQLLPGDLIEVKAGYGLAPAKGLDGISVNGTSEHASAPTTPTKPSSSVAKADRSSQNRSN